MSQDIGDTLSRVIGDSGGDRDGRTCRKPAWSSPRCSTENQTIAEVADRYGVHRSWVYRLKARYDDDRRGRVRTALTAPAHHAERDLARHRRAGAAAPQGAGRGRSRRRRGHHRWHLEHHHQMALSRATVHRILVRNSQVVPDPSKRPKSSYLRFEAEQPNETWQSDFTHYRLTARRRRLDVEIITWLDDHSRIALHISAHPRITATIVLATFTQTAAQHGYPASTLTDNGMVYTVRFAGGRGGKTKLEVELRRLGITQKNSRPNHPTTCGKVETVPTDPEEVAARPTPPAGHDRRAPDAAGPVRHRVQHPPAPPLPAAPGDPGSRLRRTPQSHPRRPQHRHPRPGPRGPGQQDRLRHPATQRPTPPHRRRPALRRNLRPTPGPRPRHHRRRHRHRRTPPRARPRPHPRLPAHRTTTRTHRENNNGPTTP